MTKFLLTAVAFTAVVLPAVAADLAPVYKAPASPLAPGWTGFYLGGTVGGEFDNNSVGVVTTNTFVNSGALSSLGKTTGPVSAIASTANIGAGSSSITGGFEAGYNWQFAPTWVLGIEADIEGLSNSGNNFGVTQVAPRIGFPGDTFTSTLSVSQRVDWLGTVRGRLGFLATPTWLIYGTGGLAYGDATSSTSITGAETPNTGTTNVAGAGSMSSIRLGWAAGVGAEYMFIRNWTVKAEWLHYDLGSASYSNGALTGVLTGTNTINFADISSSTVKFSGDIVRFGVNYKF